MAQALDSIVDDFSFLDDWEDKYRYLIELGRMLEPLPDEARTEANKVRGCASQVWLQTKVGEHDGEPIVHFRGDSDAHIVRGLIALTLAFFSGHATKDIVAGDALALFRKLGLSEHLTPQRSNGLRSMVKRIRAIAQTALEQA